MSKLLFRAAFMTNIVSHCVTLIQQLFWSTLLGLGFRSYATFGLLRIFIFVQVQG